MCKYYVKLSALAQIYSPKLLPIANLVFFVRTNGLQELKLVMVLGFFGLHSLMPENLPPPTIIDFPSTLVPHVMDFSHLQAV